MYTQGYLGEVPEYDVMDVLDVVWFVHFFVFGN